MATRNKQRTDIELVGDDKTGRAFKSANAGLVKLSKKAALVGAAVAVAGAVAGGALALATTAALKNADVMQKNADAIGINVEVLQEYRYAAGLSGVATEKFDSALVGFTKRVGEANAGTGSLVEFLNKYDKSQITAIQATKSSGEALDLVFNLMGEMTDQTDRAALAAAAFGKSGVAMTNIMRDGADGLAAMRMEAATLGLVLGEDMLRQSEAAVDALSRMEQIAGVNMQRVLISLAPLIVSIGDAFVTAAPHIETAANALVRFIGGPQLLSIQGLKAEISELTGNIDVWQEKQKKLIDEGKRYSFDYDALENNITVDLKKIDNLRALVKDKEDLLRKMGIPGAGASGGAGGGSQAAVDAVAAERARAEKLLLAIEETNLKILGLDEELLDRQYAQQQEHLFTLLAANAITTEEFYAADEAALETHNLRKLELFDAELAAEDARMERHRADDLAAEEALNDAKLRARRGLHDGLAEIAGLMAVQNRAAFEIGKAGAIAMTMVKTYEGAQAVFASAAQVPYIGWLLAPVAAAAAVTSGIMNVKDIAKTQYGSKSTGGGGGRRGGSVSVPGVPGGGVAPAPESSIAPARAAPKPDINLTISGVWTSEAIRDIIAPELKEAYEDGYNLNVRAIG